MEVQPREVRCLHVRMTVIGPTGTSCGVDQRCWWYAERVDVTLELMWRLDGGLPDVWLGVRRRLGGILGDKQTKLKEIERMYERGTSSMGGQMNDEGYALLLRSRVLFCAYSFCSLLCRSLDCACAR
eukprot:1589863-Rhodomonas_salina.1